MKFNIVRLVYAVSVTGTPSNVDFGSTILSINSSTPIVAPDPGTDPGRVTVQGFVDTANPVPEPAKLRLIGDGLLASGIPRRKITPRN